MPRLDRGLFLSLGLVHQSELPTSLTVVVRSSTPITFTGIGGSHLSVTDLASGSSPLPTQNECQWARRIWVHRLGHPLRHRQAAIATGNADLVSLEGDT